MNIEQSPQMDIVLLRIPMLFSKEMLAYYIICFIFCLEVNFNVCSPGTQAATWIYCVNM